jgi:hypothetical protein
VRKANAFQKACSFIWVLLIYLIFLAGAITSFAGGNMLAASLNFIITGTISALQSVIDIALYISPSVNTLFSHLSSIVSNAITTAITALNFNALTTLNVIGNLNSVADSLDAIQTSATKLSSDSAAIIASKATAVAAMAAIVSGIIYLTQR